MAKKHEKCLRIRRLIARQQSRFYKKPVIHDFATYSGPSHAIALKALGKPLPFNACIHHVNGKHWDNRNCNLVICENNAYHMLLHSRTAWLRNRKAIEEYLRENPNELA